MRVSGDAAFTAGTSGAPSGGGGGVPAYSFTEAAFESPSSASSSSASSSSSGRRSRTKAPSLPPPAFAPAGSTPPAIDIALLFSGYDLLGGRIGECAAQVLFMIALSPCG